MPRPVAPRRPLAALGLPTLAGLTLAALVLSGLALAAPARAQAPPAWLAAFREYCIPFVQGRSPAAVQALARRAGHQPAVDGSRVEFDTPAGFVSLVLVGERRLCEVRPRDVDYPALQRDLGAWLPTAPDGPFKLAHGPGPDIEQQRVAAWQGPRYAIQINEEYYDDRDGIYLFVEAATPR